MSAPRVDLTGQRFGKLTVISLASISKCKHTKWLCRCDCGQETTPFLSALKSGSTRSCGCSMSANMQRMSRWDRRTKRPTRWDVLEGDVQEFLTS